MRWSERKNRFTRSVNLICQLRELYSVCLRSQSPNSRLLNTDYSCADVQADLLFFSAGLVVENALHDLFSTVSEFIAFLCESDMVFLCAPVFFLVDDNLSTVPTPVLLIYGDSQRNLRCTFELKLPVLVCVGDHFEAILNVGNASLLNFYFNAFTLMLLNAGYITSESRISFFNEQGAHWLVDNES